MNCGRIRKPLGLGWTPLLDGELQTLGVAALRLEAGQTFELDTGAHEFALVLVHGNCEVSQASGLTAPFGPRRDPFQDMPFGLMVSRSERVAFTARAPSLIGAGHAPAERLCWLPLSSAHLSANTGLCAAQTVVPACLRFRYRPSVNGTRIVMYSQTLPCY